MWKLLCLSLLLVNKSIQETKIYSYYAVPTNGPVPTVNYAAPDLSVAKDYNLCNSIVGSKACNGFNYYLPQSGHFITIGGDVSEFDSYVNHEVNNDSGILMALCPDKDISHDLTKIAYRYSVYCGRYMYAQARWCTENPLEMRQNPQKSLCRKTCVEFANSYVDYGLNVCQNEDNSVAETIRDNIIETWCNLFTDEEGCIEGTTRESEQCGYNSINYAVNEAETTNPSNECWANGNPTWESKKQELIKRAAEEEKNSQMGSIKWKVMYPYAVILVIGILTFIFWVRQRKQYKIGIIPTKKEEEFEIIPSKAQPSRDYVSDDIFDNDDDSIVSSDFETPKPTILQRESSVTNEIIRSGESIIDDEEDDDYVLAIFDYTANKEDEIELKMGERIRVKQKFDDGWAYGFNETTEKYGVFPLTCCSDNISRNIFKLPKRSASQRSHKSSISLSRFSVKTNESSPLAISEKKEE